MKCSSRPRSDRPPSLRDRLSDPGGAQCPGIHAAACAAVGKLAVDDDGGYGANAELLRPARNCRLAHVEHGHLARGARDAVHEPDGVLARRAPCAEYFYLPFLRHDSFSFPFKAI